MTTGQRKKALVVCWSNLEKDPRVVREIDWLSSDNWVVDSLGLGEKPRAAVREHFSIKAIPRLVTFRPILALILLLFPYRARFTALMESRIPEAVTRRIQEGGYDLVLVNDIDLLPWAESATIAARSVRPVDCLLDLHEYHNRNLPNGTSLRPLMTGYWRWLRRFIPSPAFTIRTTVAGGIAELYAREFDISRPPIVRNCPAYVDQRAGLVDPNRIKLIYHGGAAWERGLGLLIDAMRLLDDRFVLTLMLNGASEVIAELHTIARDLPGKILFTPAVPMEQVSLAINAFDLEVMLYPPTDPNLEFALPNKLFEAVQGRLGLVVGPSPSMVDIIEKYGNGAITRGWTAKDLASTLRELTAEQVTQMKNASELCASELNSEVESRSFLAVIQAG